VPPPIDVRVWETTANGGQAQVLVLLKEQADLSAAPGLPDRNARLRYVYDALRTTAIESQGLVRAELDAAGADYHAFYVVNAIATRAERDLLSRLAALPEVARIVANPTVRQDFPEPEREALGPEAVAGIEWNVLQVNADDVWAMGYDGQGVVVAGQDTGYDWQHPALIRQYRGYDGITATHDYNWHDAIHTSDSDCGADSPVPCDDGGHGTHTLGTIVGDDGGSNRIGVAPGAQWIGCRNMEEGRGSPASYLECFEFFLAPYPLGGDPFTDGEPSLAPHVINNSWTCPPTEGCAPGTLEAAVENVRAAGIMVVASAGNSGPECGSVQAPPAIYEAAFCVGSTDVTDLIAGSSSRGPVTVDGSGRSKPDVAAPGVSVRSCGPNNAYLHMSGTSMAGPHVAGTAALVWSAAPQLRGDVDATQQLIQRSADPRATSQACGGDGPNDVPNNTYGWGIVDALAAVHQAELGLSISVDPDPVATGSPLTYTYRVTNIGTRTITAEITAVLPAQVVPTGSFTWTAADLSPGTSWTKTVAAGAAQGYAGPLVTTLTAASSSGTTAVYTATSEAAIAELAVSKEVHLEPFLSRPRLTYALSVANTGEVAAQEIFLTDTLPLSTVFHAASGNYARDRGVVTWTASSLLPQEVLTRWLTVTADNVPPGTEVVNARYGARARGMPEAATGEPVRSTIPWRVLLYPVVRNWPGGEPWH